MLFFDEFSCVFRNLYYFFNVKLNGKIICTNSITFGDYARIGSELQVIDTNFHQMINVLTKEKFEISATLKKEL